MKIEDKQLTYRLFGKKAMFTDPITREGEKTSYGVPTYSALVGITESIYWKPSIQYVIDEVRIINKIKKEEQATTWSKVTNNQSNKPNGIGLSYYTYLIDVEYEVKCHMVWNENFVSTKENDDKPQKHWDIFQRALKNGGRKPIFLGTSECNIAYVEPLENYGEKESYYDGVELDFHTMFHSFDYPTLSNPTIFNINLSNIKVIDGKLIFEKKENCIKRKIQGVNLDTSTNDILYSQAKDLVEWGK